VTSAGVGEPVVAGIVIPSIVWLVDTLWVVGLVHPALESIRMIMTRMLSIQNGFMWDKRFVYV
jgi:hypothetical protein